MGAAELLRLLQGNSARCSAPHGLAGRPAGPEPGLLWNECLEPRLESNRFTTVRRRQLGLKQVIRSGVHVKHNDITSRRAIGGEAAQAALVTNSPGTHFPIWIARSTEAQGAHLPHHPLRQWIAVQEWRTGTNLLARWPQSRRRPATRCQLPPKGKGFCEGYG